MLYLDTRSIEKPDGYTDFFKSLAVFFKAILLILTFSPYAFIRPKQKASFHLSHKRCRNHWCRWSGCSIRPSHRCHNTIVLPGRNCQWSWAEHQFQKSWFLCYNQHYSRTIKSLKKRKHQSHKGFTYLKSIIVWTKRDIDIRLGKAWSAQNKLDVIWLYSLLASLKWKFSQEYWEL